MQKIYENIFITSYIPIYFSYLKNLKPLTRSMGKKIRWKLKKNISYLYFLKNETYNLVLLVASLRGKWHPWDTWRSKKRICVPNPCKDFRRVASCKDLSHLSCFRNRQNVCMWCLSREPDTLSQCSSHQALAVEEHNDPRARPKQSFWSQINVEAAQHLLCDRELDWVLEAWKLGSLGVLRL